MQLKECMKIAFAIGGGLFVICVGGDLSYGEDKNFLKTCLKGYKMQL